MSLSETFQEHVEEYDWSAKEQVKVLLEFLDEKVKWNIFVDYLCNNHPLTLPPEEPLTPEQQARADEKYDKLALAKCLLVLTADEKSVCAYPFPTTFPRVIQQIKKMGAGTYILSMGDKDGQPLRFDAGDLILRREITT